MYVLKFNSPILPFAKFPLHKNEYIKGFLQKFEKDQPMGKILGVHFSENKNENAEGAIGVEISMKKQGGMYMVESKQFRRY